MGYNYLFNDDNPTNNLTGTANKGDTPKTEKPKENEVYVHFFGNASDWYVSLLER